MTVGRRASVLCQEILSVGRCGTAWVLPGRGIQEGESESMPKKEATGTVFCNLISEIAYVTYFNITAFTIFF